jgi:hypothetical protein
MLRSASVRASDPVLAAITTGGETIGGLRSALPLNFPDTALNQAKYRIIATGGVLTPGKGGTQALDFVCGSGGTQTLIRGKIQAEIEEIIDDLKTKLADKVNNKINGEIHRLSDAAKKAMADGLKPGGDFAAAVDTAKINGCFDQYREMIEGQTEGLVNETANRLAAFIDKVGGRALDEIASRLKNLEALQKGADFLDKLNPGMVVSLYKTVSSADPELSLGEKIFALYYSPLLKLGLYDNGDFVSTKKSQLGDDVLLFNNAQDVLKYEFKASDPLAPFAGIAAMGLGLDAAYYLSLSAFPAAAEPIRIAKISAVNILSIVVAVAKQKELSAYFAQGHKAGISLLYQPGRMDEMMFDKPWVSVQSPDGD